MTHERQPRTSGTEAQHLSLLGREALRQHAAGQLHTIGLELHDFFRYGHPLYTAELECFLLEGGSGRHAEVLLDELAYVLSVLGEERGMA